MVEWMAWGMAAADQQQGWRKGPWTPEEDKILAEYVSQHGEGRWSSVSRCAGLNRIGKSCRLRWVNYLRPGLKRGQITPQEEGIIIELHALWGNKWSTIARYLPGRTDNEIKNYWRTHFKKRDRLTSHKIKSRKVRTQKHIQQPNQMMPQPQQTPHQGDAAPPIGEAKVNTTKAEEDNNVITADYAAMEDCHLGLVSYTNNEDATNQDDFLWGGSLWSFNDSQGAHSTTPEGHQMQEQLCNKVGNIQNQDTLNDLNGFSWGSGNYAIANYNTLLYNEGYSFLLS